MQNETPQKIRLYGFWLPGLLIVAGLVLILAQFFGDYTLIVNSGKREARGLAFTSGQLLRAAMYNLQPEDEVYPAPAKLNLSQRTIVLNQARPVTIQSGEAEITLFSAGAMPADVAH